MFVLAIISALLQISKFTQFIVGDKCDAINPFIEKYFTNYLDGHNSCFEVETYLQSGCWLLFFAAIMFFAASIIVMKVCRNALYERLPDHVKEYLKQRKNQKNGKNTNNDLIISKLQCIHGFLYTFFHLHL